MKHDDCDAADGPAPRLQTFTVGQHGHGFERGSIVHVVVSGTRLQRLLRLAVRPRVLVVDAATATTFTTRERRMTWREWRSELWAAVRGA